MKITIVGPTYPYRSGVSHYMTLLFRELKKKHDVCFYSFSRQYPSFLFPGKNDRDQTSQFHIREDGVRYEIDSLNPVTWFRVASRILNVKPDCVILPWWTVYWCLLYFCLICMLKKDRNIKIIFLCHNIYDHDASWIQKVLAAAILRLGDHFIVHSEDCRMAMFRIKSTADVSVVSHPEYSIFNQNRMTDEQAKESLNLKGNILLHFGVIRPYKGIDDLIAAMPEVLKRVDATLLVVGERWRGFDIEAQLAKYPGIESRVRLVTNYIPNEEVERYFRAADVVVLPYVETSASGVLQVALAFDKPVIGTETGALKDVIHDGMNGYLVPVRNPQRLADKIVRFFTENKKTEFSGNIKNMKNQFAWSNMAQCIERFVNHE